MTPIIRKSDFSKWIAFAFPYLAQIIHEIIINSFALCSGYELESHMKETIFILVNSLSILFGFQILNQYTKKDNCLENNNSQNQK